MTTNDAQIAREWAERAMNQDLSDDVPRCGYRAAARHILDTTTPPTMADIAWDDEAHHLAEATAAWSDGYPSTVIMLNKFGKKIVVYQPSSHYSGMRELNPGILTPTGRKYRLELTPPSEPAEDTPDHPAVLTTEEDYENAPTGTIVAGDYGDPWVKDDLGFWLVGGGGGSEISRLMVFDARRVLRWGETL